MRREVITISYDEKLCGPFPLERMEYNGIEVFQREGRDGMAEYCMLIPEYMDPVWVGYRIGEMIGVGMMVMQCYEGEKRDAELSKVYNPKAHF